jgi:ssDNA-binding Zn-finger/Zn-ribbon topoisomerase 1
VKYKVHGETKIPCIQSCPLCGSDQLQWGGYGHTLVGYSGGPEKDGNHYTGDLFCRGCDTRFAEEWVPRSRAYWITVAGSRDVIYGEPGCCDTQYSLPCECGGKISHTMQGKSYGGGSNATGDWGPKQPMVWTCDSCSKTLPDRHWGYKFAAQEQVDAFWARQGPPPPPDSLEPMKRVKGWTFAEEIGGVIIANPRLLAKGMK